MSQRSNNPADGDPERADGNPRPQGGDVRRRSSAISKEDWANLDEYGKIVKYVSAFRDPGKDVEGEEGEFQECRVWYAPWKKRRVRAKEAEKDGIQLPDEWLTTDIHKGLGSHEVMNRRRRAGWNELVSEKENPIAKLMSYFRGPILYGRTRISAFSPDIAISEPFSCGF